MKNNIKIMNSKPDVSDEEIQSYMNFDSLLEQHHKISSKGDHRILRRSLYALAVLAVLTIAWYGVISTKKAPQSPVDSSESPTSAAPEPLRAPTDSSEKIIDTAISEKRERIRKPKHITKNPGKDDIVASDTLENKIEETEEETLPPVYIQAEPVNGYPALYEYFNSTLKYPVEALPDSVEGVVTVIFTIGKTGKAEKIEIEQSLGEFFDREAIRVIEHMPLWKPATYNQKPVSSRITLPLTFNLNRINIK
jgi:TonB family protein